MKNRTILLLFEHFLLVLVGGAGTTTFLLWQVQPVAGLRPSTSTMVQGVAVHPVPLRHNDPSSPYVFAASSNVADLGSVSFPPKSEGGDLRRRGSVNFLATQVWPSARSAAHALVRHLLPPDRTSSSVVVVCEFGCGVGLPSLTAAKLGAARVYATDLDEFALELVQAAAEAQDLSETVETKAFDLVHSYADEIPFADLYLFSDVFESDHVAEGAARVTAEILERRGESTVWVFAQSDRAQRETYLAELQRLLDDPTLYWQSSSDRQQRAIQSNNRLWLCDVDEMKDVLYC